MYTDTHNNNNNKQNAKLRTKVQRCARRRRNRAPSRRRLAPRSIIAKVKRRDRDHTAADAKQRYDDAIALLERQFVVAGADVIGACHDTEPVEIRFESQYRDVDLCGRLAYTLRA